MSPHVIDLSNHQSGFCDRLRGVTFHLALARLQGNNRLHICEHTTEACPFLFNNLCRIKGFEIEVIDSKTVAHATFRVDWIRFPAGALYAKKLLPRDFPISAEEFANLWISSYDLLRPRRDLQRRIDKLSLTTATLGIHIRRTDKTPRNMKQQESTEAFGLRMDRLDRASEALMCRALQKRQCSNFYLACDNQSSNKVWQNLLSRYGLPVISNKPFFDPSRLRQTTGEDFIIDLFALANCGAILNTGKSGVPITAARLSGRPISIYSV